MDRTLYMRAYVTHYETCSQNLDLISVRCWHHAIYAHRRYLDMKTPLGPTGTAGQHLSRGACLDIEAEFVRAVVSAGVIRCPIPRSLFAQHARAVLADRCHSVRGWVSSRVVW